MIRKKLKHLRLDNEFTQRDIAKRLNMTHSNYCKIENGDRGLTIETALKLKKTFGVDHIDDLLEEEELRDS